MPKTLGIISPTVRTGYSTQHGYQGDEAANSTHQVGHLLTATNGKLGEVGVGAAAVNKPLRLALSAGQNLAAPVQRVEFAHPEEFGVLQITAGGAASTAALLQAGKTYGLAKDATTGAHYLNLADTTNPVFRIEDSKPALGDVGDTNVRVYVSLLPANR